MTRAARPDRGTRPGNAQGRRSLNARGDEAGAALLAALLVVAMVATLASAGLWQQWRSIEVEAAERQRSQASWVLAGALDWARLILREDAAAGGVDHLGEPWAVPLREARLATFLASNRNATTADMANTDVDKSFLSGEMVDLQSRLNISNLVDGQRISPPGLRAAARLFELLGLPPNQVESLAEQMLRASLASQGRLPEGGAPAPLLPQDTAQLAWLGLPPETLAAIAPYVAVLPVRTPVNLNTAPAPVIYAALDGISLGDAQRLVSHRAGSHLRTLADATALLGENARTGDGVASVSSGFFEVRSRLRIESVVVEERYLLQRDKSRVMVLQRQRGPATQQPR